MRGPTLVLVLLALLLTACATGPGLPSTEPAVPPGALAGKWAGELVGPEGPNPIQVALEEKDGNLVGTHSIRHAMGGHTTSGWIRGSVSGRKITLRTEHATMWVELSNDGQQLTGSGRSSVFFRVRLARQD